jgi:hypothetical protein
MFRFTIRDVLWLTVVVAMGAGWWVDHRHSAYEREVIRKLRVLGFDTDSLWGNNPAKRP